MKLPRLVRVMVAVVLPVGIGALAGGCAGEVYSAAQTPQYAASARTFVSAGSSDVQTRILPISQSSRFGAEVAQSYADVATSPLVLDAVIRQLGLRETRGMLAERISATRLPDTTLIQITATDPSPTRAARLANAISTRLVAVVAMLTANPSATASPGATLTLIQPAKPPLTPAGPAVPVAVTLGLVLGAAGGAAVAVARSAGRGARPRAA